MRIFRNLFKNQEPELPSMMEIKVVNQKRKWFKNGNHKLFQLLEFYDHNGEQIGFGKINRTYKPKT